MLHLMYTVQVCKNCGAMGTTYIVFTLQGHLCIIFGKKDLAGDIRFRQPQDFTIIVVHTNEDNVLDVLVLRKAYSLP